MTAPNQVYVLYKDAPQKRYRRIAARCEESPFHLQFLVEITEGEPFDFENSEVRIVPCNNHGEAIARVEEERASGLNTGWREYPDAPQDVQVSPPRS
jgi:hypothetical protein